MRTIRGSLEPATSCSAFTTWCHSMTLTGIQTLGTWCSLCLLLLRWMMLLLLMPRGRGYCGHCHFYIHCCCSCRELKTCIFLFLSFKTLLVISPFLFTCLKRLFVIYNRSRIYIYILLETWPYEPFTKCKYQSIYNENISLDNHLVVFFWFLQLSYLFLFFLYV